MPSAIHRQAALRRARPLRLPQAPPAAPTLPCRSRQPRPTLLVTHARRCTTRARHPYRPGERVVSFPCPAARRGRGATSYTLAAPVLTLLLVLAILAITLAHPTHDVP